MNPEPDVKLFILVIIVVILVLLLSIWLFNPVIVPYQGNIIKSL
jgi:hypothetical protein